MSKSNLISEERKIRIINKNKLKNELSLIQLLFLINKCNLQNELNVSGGIYEYKAADLLSQNIDTNDIENLIQEASSVNADLISLEFYLNKLSEKELKNILKDITNYNHSKSLLSKQVFLFIPLETIKKELDYKGPISIPDEKKDKKSDKKSKPIKSKFNQTKDKISIEKSESYSSKQISTGQDIIPPVSKQKSENVEVNKLETDEKKINIQKNEDKSKTTIFKVNEENIESKLLEYDLDYLLDILFDHRKYFDSIKDLNRKEFEKQKEELKDKIDKGRLVKIILDENSPQILEEYFNQVVYEFFPYSDTFERAREFQVETISQIYNAIKNGYKYIFLEAVAGFGKSLIAATLTRIYSKEKSYILTPTNQLLTPYEEQFGDFGLYITLARSNFTCQWTRANCSPTTCRTASCPYYDSSCEYFSQLRKGLKSSAVVSTYSYFFKETFYQSNDLEHRKLLICDEGHNIDDMVSQGVSLNIYLSRLKRINGRDIGDFDIDSELKDLEQTEDYYLFLLKLEYIYDLYLNDENADRNLKIKIEKDLEYLRKFLSYFERSDNNIAFEKTGNKLIFYPIKIKKFVPDVLGKFADVCIFMSSSIFDHENFAFDLGIDESEVFKIKVPNIFNSSDNPIKIYNLDMSYEKLKEENAEKSIPIIKEIFKMHKNDKGVIHTFSDECKEFLKSKLKSTNRIVTHTTNDREEVLNNFKEDENGNDVLISPSMDVGVDLPGDLCRFQIIFKLPYYPYKSSRINKRKGCYEDGDDWYDYKMLTRLIQAYGRGIRFKGDYCKTYILDKRLLCVIDEDYEGKQIIPKYFLDAIVDED